MLNEGNQIHYFIVCVCESFCDTMKQIQHYIQMTNIHIQFHIIHAVPLQSVLWNRNPGTVTFWCVEREPGQKVGTGTVINYGSEP